MWQGTVGRGGVEVLTFAPDGRTIYTRSATDLMAWDVATRKPTRFGTAGGMASHGAIVPTPDGRVLVVHENNFDVYEFPAGKLVERRTFNNVNEFMDPVFIDAGRHLLTVVDPRSAVWTIALRAWPGLDPVPFPKPNKLPRKDYQAVVADPTGRHVTALARGDKKAKLLLLAPTFATTAAAVEVEWPWEVFWYAVAPDGTAVVGPARKRVVAYEVPSKTLRFDVKLGKTDVARVAYHPTGRLIAAATNDGAVHFLDARTGAVLRSYDWQIGKPWKVVFSPDGATCAVGGNKKAFVVWDVDV